MSRILVEPETLPITPLRQLPLFAAALKAIGLSFERLAQAAQQVADLTIENAVGDQLDKFRAILNLERDGLSDIEYRKALTVQGRLYRSQGTVRDITEVLDLLQTVERSWVVSLHGGYAYVQGTPAYRGEGRREAQAAASAGTTVRLLQRSIPGLVRPVFAFAEYNGDETINVNFGGVGGFDTADCYYAELSEEL